MTDDRWDIRKQEAEEIARLERGIERLQASLRIRQVVAALEGEPRFQAFLGSIRAMVKDAEEKLIRALSDTEMRQLQGRVMALRDVADICTNAKTQADRLEIQLRDAQSQREQAVQRGGRVVPAGTRSWQATTAAPVQPR